MTVTPPLDLDAIRQRHELRLERWHGALYPEHDDMDALLARLEEAGELVEALERLANHHGYFESQELRPVGDWTSHAEVRALARAALARWRGEQA